MMCGTPEEARVLQWVSDKALEVLAAKRVLLFGSRARGDADDRSDFDIAVETDCPEKIAEFLALLEENPVTLLAFDVVNLATAKAEFRDRILAEGRDITAASAS
jgi:predicted nucleotidyltransferase